MQPQKLRAEKFSPLLRVTLRTKFSAASSEKFPLTEEKRNTKAFGNAQIEFETSQLLKRENPTAVPSVPVPIKLKRFQIHTLACQGSIAEKPIPRTPIQQRTSRELDAPNAKMEPQNSGRIFRPRFSKRSRVQPPKLRAEKFSPLLGVPLRPKSPLVFHRFKPQFSGKGTLQNSV